MPLRMYKYRLYPSKNQIKNLKEHLELCRQTYNQLLLYCRSVYQERGKLPTHFDMNNKLVKMKLNYTELRKVHSQVLQSITKRIRDAYNCFYIRRRLRMRAGPPRIKASQRYRSITYPQSGFKVEENWLRLSKLGIIRIKLHRPLKGVIKTITIKCMTSGKWFACFSCEIESTPMFKRVKAVGIDMGLKNFAVLSDGTSIENPCYYRLYGRRLKRLQRRLSKKGKGARNREKARILVARLHETIMNCRTDFLHETSRVITNTFETVYVEDLRIRNMIKNHHLAKSIGDVGWGRFMKMLCYKEEESGGRVIFVNPHGTSQLCSGCGEIVPKSLSYRSHICTYCELVLDSDVNASRNVVKIGRGPPDFKPVETLASAQPYKAGQVSSMKQESPPLLGG